MLLFTESTTMFTSVFQTHTLPFPPHSRKLPTVTHVTTSHQCQFPQKNKSIILSHFMSLLIDCGTWNKIRPPAHLSYLVSLWHNHTEKCWHLCSAWDKFLVDLKASVGGLLGLILGTIQLLKN